MRLLLHKGLDDGAERLRAQLRDTAQQGRRDEYGGDDIEDTAVSGSKRAAAELLKQRKKKATEQPSDPARNGASAPDAHRNESPIIRTKDTEFAETQTPAATPQAQARRAAMQKAAAVKTKDTYIETQVKTSVTEAPEPQRQGQRAFVREQGRKAMRQTRLRQTEQNRRLRNTSLGLGTSETIGTAQSAEDLSHKSIKERTSIPFPKASQKALLKKDGQAEYSVQKTAQAAGRALRAILAAARSLLATMMAGGSTVVSMVLVICLIGLLIASPFGIFFSGEDSGTGYTMPEAVRTLNGEFTDRIEKIKAENPHDELDMNNAGNAAMIANWRDVLAIYAVRTTTDDTSPDEVATLTAEKLDILRQIFWDMNAISYWVETISGDEDESDTVILHITVTVKDHLQMADMLKTRFICKNITVTALSASTLTLRTAPGAQANTSAKVCPGPDLERMLRFPQMSSCTIRALPASTSPTSSTASPARSRREPLGKASILAPRQESMAASSSSEIPEKSAAVWSTGKNSFINNPLSLKIQPTC